MPELGERFTTSMHGLSPLSVNIHKRISLDTKDKICANLTWKDLKVVVNGNQTVLQGVSGYADDQKLVAIMGPSGSGKSTLLDTLAGRLTKQAQYEGEIMLNGRKEQLSFGTAAYVAQDDVLLGTLTVLEILHYSAQLRFHKSIEEQERKDLIKAAATDVGLLDCLHTIIGNWHKRGLSGGEKRRVSIAIELLKRPRLLFLDEPTSGLDSASAYHVVQTLKNLTKERRTVVCSIHQPSSDVFELFDALCLLSGGKQVFFGPLAGAQEFFANAGFPCPTMRNPSDHYLRTINSDFDNVHTILQGGGSQRQDIENSYSSFSNPMAKMTTAEQVKILVHLFETSDEKRAVSMRIEELKNEGGRVLASRGSDAAFLTQCWVLTKRSVVNMRRDWGYYWLRLVMYIMLSICIGTIYYKVGKNYTSIMARAACISYVAGFLTFMSIGGFPSFVEDMKVFGRERMNGHYGVAAFAIGNTLSSLPFLFLISVASTMIVYFLVGLHPGITHVIYFLLALFACLVVVESLMMAVASLVPNFLMGIITGAGIQGIFLLVSGFFRLPNDLPKYFWRYPMMYFGFHMYALQGMYENDFTGLTFANTNPSLPRITGEEILVDHYQITVSRSKWWNLSVLFLMAVGYRVIFYVLIRINETYVPLARAYFYRKFHSFRRNNNATTTSISPEE
ncbi:ATP-binding cassette, subfamily G (WHITE), member 2 [Marchantia polymorpha subsp. ruderalis]|uniref:ABC transporter domain-containing protein n=2 Tax=Marchantia polymorpha TaxID=3197 RepID=A0A176WFF1_MARPO|nr:hypothetical protein AXG93_3789s1030 [Marchantia polymorpha subsp. ruderalis]PTQ40076.1 hypothetical protein MARPO_0042s0109 [Marchantia polymorpha]BBN02381.1 hypothetical protein Mp_2g14870 [Marchantia polymorpha subsp. ruderalis]|eukprot:PTQ40076.1 hypothetical protein MARPO_0042s0109 [Marchantia polymorpha]